MNLIALVAGGQVTSPARPGFGWRGCFTQAVSHAAIATEAGNSRFGSTTVSNAGAGDPPRAGGAAPGAMALGFMNRNHLLKLAGGKK